MTKRSRNGATFPRSEPLVLHKAYHPFESLPPDMLDAIVELLGVDVLVLRQVCWTFSKLRLSPAMELALTSLRARTSLPTKFHVHRTPAALCYTREWSQATHGESFAWRRQWATLVRDLDQAPIKLLIDAHNLLPPAIVHNGPAEYHGYLRHQDHLKEAAPPLGDNELDDRWHRLTPSEKQVWMHPDAARYLMGNRHVLDIREQMSAAIEDRMWEVCCGEDRYKTGNGRWVIAAMSREEAACTVKRMLEEVGLHNGSTAFWHTRFGYLGMTPFLLAAERHNLPLVRYLFKRHSSHLTVRARSRFGNNSYALCKAHMLRKGHSHEQIEESEVLRYLLRHGVDEEPLIATCGAHDLDW